MATGAHPPPSPEPEAEATTARSTPVSGPNLAAVLPIAGLAVALWASLPQYSGPKLNVEAAKEVADHIVPAAVVLVASLVAILVGRRAKGPGSVRFMAGMGVLLAGLWMMATHLPLVAEALRDEAPWPATIYHTSAALAVFGLGLLWATVTWSEAGETAEAPVPNPQHPNRVHSRSPYDTE